MKSTNPRILTINGGSSSIKFALFKADDSLQRLFLGKMERIGLPEANFQVKGLSTADNVSKQMHLPDHATAVTVLMEWIEAHCDANALVAIGHRVVHGGPKYIRAELITSEMIQELRKLSSFDLEHMPGEILLIETLRKSYPHLPQVACFDTAFHSDLPLVAKMLPIPRRFGEKGVRRYGFHGLSYEFLLRQLDLLAGSKVSKGRVIFAHLGNGSSLAAVKNGKSIDTSMGFTPASGVPMSSRSGDLDPGLVWYLARTEGFDAKQFNEMIHSHSGLLGISETSSDMQELLKNEQQDFRAAEAVALFCYQVKKWIGSFAAALGGLDTLVFSGGIGENSPLVRSRICEGLDFLGIALDANQNEANGALISSGPTAVRVIHTDEEWMIAKTVLQSMAK